jgi:hypothetical protein
VSRAVISYFFFVVAYHVNNTHLSGIAALAETNIVLMMQL